MLRTSKNFTCHAADLSSILCVYQNIKISFGVHRLKTFLSRQHTRAKLCTVIFHVEDHRSIHLSHPLSTTRPLKDLIMDVRSTEISNEKRKGLKRKDPTGTLGNVMLRAQRRTHRACIAFADKRRRTPRTNKAKYAQRMYYGRG